MKKTSIKSTPGDFGSEKGVTLACGSSSTCCCMVFLGGGLGGIIGFIYGLVRGFAKGSKWSEESSGIKTFSIYTFAMITLGIGFAIVGLLIGAGIGISIDLIMGNL
ncbi:hypothetical protein [Candidatus Uabimicrobium sp. HlEnr_7]|uniref:hypothetical protein n=1 Tax=Candidatus Uabimicrobium helgolandensis TaxID=3095367 RepID=UPI0035578976